MKNKKLLIVSRSASLLATSILATFYDILVL